MGEGRSKLDPRRDRPRLDRVAGAGRCPPALAAIEAAAEPLGIPIVDRDTGRVLLGPRRRPAADRRGRHGLRLLDALDGPRPARRRHDRDDRSGHASGPTSRAAGGARRASPTSGSRSSTRPRSTRSRRGEPALAGPFDLAFIDALKPEYEALPRRRSTSRLAPGALVVADNVLWSGRVSGARPVAAGRREHRRAARVRRGGPRRSALQRDDPAGRRRPARRLVARLTAADGVAIRIRVRLFAVQRELAGTREVALELPDGARRRGGLDRARRALPGPRARPRRRSASRATATTPTRRRRSPTATRSR